MFRVWKSGSHESNCPNVARVNQLAEDMLQEHGRTASVAVAPPPRAINQPMAPPMPAEDRYGPWLQARRPRRLPNKATAHKGASTIKENVGGIFGVNPNTSGPNQRGSRFDILSNFEDPSDANNVDTPVLPSMTPQTQSTYMDKNNSAKENAASVASSSRHHEEGRARRGKSIAHSLPATSSDTCPITVGPLSHSEGIAQKERGEGGRLKTVKLHKTRADFTPQAETRVEFHPGEQARDSHAKDPMQKKLSKARLGAKLGKRKNEMNPAAEPPAPDDQSPLIPPAQLVRLSEILQAPGPEVAEIDPDTMEADHTSQVDSPTTARADQGMTDSA